MKLTKINLPVPSSEVGLLLLVLVMVAYLFGECLHAETLGVMADDGHGLSSYITDNVLQGSTDIGAATTLDNRIPLLLIHGINLVPTVTLYGRKYLPLTEGWGNFLTYFYSQPNLTAKYKIYLYGYRSNEDSVEQVGKTLNIILSNISSHNAAFARKDIVIVAHSLGGLVARSFMEEYQRTTDGEKWGERVIKLITLGTPHHGTPLAHSPFPTSALGKVLSLQDQIGWIELEVLSPLLARPWYEPNRVDALWDNYDNLFSYSILNAREEFCWLSKFNASSMYDSKLLLYSGRITTTDLDHGVYLPLRGLLEGMLGIPNDGFVPVNSARFANRPLIFDNSRRDFFTDYNHTQMWQGKNNDNSLFNSLRQDLLTIATSVSAPGSFNFGVAQSCAGNIPVNVLHWGLSERATSFRVFRDNLPLSSSLAANAREFTDNHVTPGQRYLYKIIATSANNLTTDSATLPLRASNCSTPDTAPPGPPILNGGASAWSRNNLFYIDWTNPDDPSGIARVWVKYGSAPTSPTDGLSYPLPLHKPFPVVLNQAEGTQTIYLWLEDGEGNKSHLPGNRAIATLRLDPTRPTVTIVPPAFTVTSQNSINLSGIFADNLSGVVSVMWLNSIGNSGNANTSGAGLSGTWSAGPIALTGGVNTIAVTATDAAGNVGSASITITSLTANNSGSMRVTIAPPAAMSAGAKWRFGGEVLWHQSDEVVNSYTGTRTINFAPADGWTPPPDSTVTINTGQTTPLAVTYTVPLSLQPPYTASQPYPPNGTGDVVRNSLNLSWLGGSPNGTVSYALAIEANPNPTVYAGYGAINGSSYQVPFTLQPATTYFWRILTKDINNNVTVGPVWSFTTQYVIPDLIPTNLSLDGNISPGATVTAHVTVINQGSFTAQGAYVNLYLSRTRGAKELQLNPISAPRLFLPAALAPGQSVTLSCQVTLTNLSTGQSFIDAWIDSSPWGSSAESDYNNNTTSLAINYIDGAPPIVSYFAPQNAFAKTGAPMTLVLTATDDDKISTLDFYYSVDGGTAWTTIQEGYVPPTSPAYGISYPWTLPTTLPVGGNLLLRVVATDPSGNFGERIAGPYVIRDGTAPVVRVIFPNGGETLPAGSVQQIRWSISAPNGIANASLSLYYDNNHVDTAQGITDYTTGTYSWTLPATLTTAVGKIRIIVYDRNGNTAEDWSDAPFSIVDNSQPPPAPWTAAAAVTSAGTGDPAGIPRVVADGTGALHLIYGLSHDAAAHTISFRYRKRTGITWTSPSVVSFDVTSLDNQRGSSYSIEYARWRFALDGNGHPHLVWATSFDNSSEENKNDIFYTTFDGVSWATPQNISGSIASPVMANSLAWTRKADLPATSFSAMAAATVGGKLYYIYYEQIYEYDPVANTWTRKADAPSTAVNDGGATVVNGLIYAAGGYDGTIRIYNPSADSWATGSAMPSPQQGVRLVTAANGMIYAIGGDTGGYSGDTKTRMYNPGTDSWTVMAEMPTARSHPAVAAVGANIYVIGGFQQRSMDVYDSGGNTWTTKAYPIVANIPNSFGGFAAVANNRIYYFPGVPYGGTGDSSSHDVWEYDPATGGWTRMLPTQFVHGFACGAAIGSKLYVLGGYDGFNYIKSMEEATLSTALAGTVSSSPQVAVDAANGVHLLWIDGQYLRPEGSEFYSFSYAGERNVYESVNNGSGWSAPVQVTTGGVNRHTVVADQSRNLHLSWQTYRGDIAYSKRSGGSWSAPLLAGVALSASYGLDMAVDSTMKVHFLYAGYNNPPIALSSLNYITLDGASWSPPERVIPYQSGWPPRLCLDSLNRPHAIWEGSSGNPQVLYSTRSGGGWVAPIQLNRAAELPAGGSVDAALWSGSNELDVVWLGDNSGNRNVLLNHANVGSALDIYPPTVAVNSPVPGDILSIGNPATITWTATDNVGVTTVEVSYSTNGTIWTPIATGLANTGSYQWTVPNVTNAQVRVTANDAAGNSGFGISGALSPADLTPPSVAITSPATSASLTAGGPVTILWTAADNVGVVQVDLEFSLDNGAGWQALASGLGNTGSYAWTVPNTPTAGWLIRATARDAAGLSAAMTTQPLTVVRANTPPLAPSHPFPPDGSAFVLRQSPNFRWSSSDPDGDALAFFIRFGTNANPPLVLTTGDASFNPPALRPQRTYYWQVLASDGQATNAGPVWSFTTEAGALPQPSLAEFRREADGGFGFQFNGLFGEAQVVQASTNLVDWVTVATFGSSNGASIFLDSTATNLHRRFYRVITP